MKDKESKDTGRDVFISYATDKDDSHASRDPGPPGRCVWRLSPSFLKHKKYIKTKEDKRLASN
jgi:hypothetical protein